MRPCSATCAKVVDSQRCSPRRSWHVEPPLVEQEAKTVQEQLAGESLVAIHEVADQDEEDDEDIQMHKRSQKEVVGQEQERLCPVATLDRADHARRLDRVDGVDRSFEPDSLGEAGHDELRSWTRRVGGCSRGAGQGTAFKSYR
jgi:hypothetical protein